VLEALVTSKRDEAAAVKLLKRILKKYCRPQSIDTDRLRAYSAAMKEIGTRSVAASIIGRRIHTSRFDDESVRCSGFEV
jgi:transposase-like protein